MKCRQEKRQEPVLFSNRTLLFAPQVSVAVVEGGAFELRVEETHLRVDLVFSSFEAFDFFLSQLMQSCHQPEEA